MTLSSPAFVPQQNGLALGNKGLRTAGVRFSIHAIMLGRLDDGSDASKRQVAGWLAADP